MRIKRVSVYKEITVVLDTTEWVPCVNWYKTAQHLA